MVGCSGRLDCVGSKEFVDWIENWQRVKGEGCFSDWIPATCGASGFGAGPIAVHHPYQ